MSHNNISRSTRRLSKQRSPRALGLVLGVLMLGGCKASERETSNVTRDVLSAPDKQERTLMWMTIGERRFSVTLADTDAARVVFSTRLPLTLDMAELNGNEKHADISQALPTDASRPGTIHNGDLMLYGSKTVVVFYKTFRSPYAYTRLGRVDDPDDLSRALGRSNSRVVFSEQ